ncbi:solute carrier family 41 member 1-like [Mucor ambiguus]|uniref:Solute carrier family 41 member 1-like n=1 Tax=Mucor ambiguus TaxID=91626 RepID=A0A0C9LVD6_9FUNG|nr:solute carrier family 41 member 1-like [Mucor ambiguus]
MPPNYHPVQNDAIELLTPGDHHLELGAGAGGSTAAGQQKRLGRHTRSASSSSFIHYKAPQQKEEVIPSGNKLASQALPSLLICVVGLIVAGWMMDIYQHWKVFTQVSELFILVPVLLNLKGNLEMNLAARFSTSANMGELDHPETRNALVWGNLSLIQVQALISGSIAGLFSVFLGALLHPEDSVTISESVLVIASSMVSASVSSFVLGLFMCILIIISRMLKIDPDNIACPMASSLGDVVTLGILAGCANLLLVNMETNLSTYLLLIMFISIPFFGLSVWRNPHVRDLLFSGWTPIIIAMLISSGAGLVLERYVEKFKGLAMITPILCGLAGNLGSIYASRISTCLHRGVQEQFSTVEPTLLLMNIPVQILFLFIAWILDIGHLDFTFAFALTYFIVSMICTFTALKMGKSMTLGFWKYKYDPDNYVLPYLTAIIDVICTSLLVISFSWLSTNGFASLEEADHIK